MFDVTMMPASEGDALLIRYGDPAAPRSVLIDAGRKATYRHILKQIPEEDRHLELFVISHVDRDHIEGAISILGEEDNGFSFDDIWFNGYEHLVWDDEIEQFGAEQGEDLTGHIKRRGLPWNRAFGGGPVRLDGDAPAVRTLPGGLTITLLSPDSGKLAKLAPKWRAECARAGIVPGGEIAEDAPSEDPEWESGLEMFGGSLLDLAQAATAVDTAAPNGSSIAFLAEYEGKRVLFGADAHPGLLARSLGLLGQPLPIACDLVKVPHHGSQANSTIALFEHVESDHYFVSTNGTYFEHPDPAAIARIVTRPGAAVRTIYFNYAQDHTRVWDEDEASKAQYGYRCVFPGAQNAPVTLSL